MAIISNRTVIAETKKLMGAFPVVTKRGRINAHIAPIEINLRLEIVPRSK